MKIGAHQSTAGGYSKAIERIIDIGGNCLQIFSTSPRGWKPANPSENELAGFLSSCAEKGIGPVYFHASYLINLADEGSIGHLSRQSMIAEMKVAPKAGIKGSIVHLGSYKGLKTDGKYARLISNIRRILEETPKETKFIIENAGNRKIGQTLAEISRIVKDVSSDRVRLCLDTCHLFSNGYRFDEADELDSFLGKLEELELLDRLELWHLNDSRDPFNSGKDRHANFGEGEMGLEPFRVLLNHRRTRNYPFIAEVPGFTDDGPDRKNLEILKSLL